MESNAPALKQTTSAGGLAGAVIAVLVGFEIVHWSVAQVGLVGAATASGLALLGSLWAHFRGGTSQEPVAIGTSITAFAPTMIGTLVGFHVITWTDEQIGLVMSLLTLGIAAVVGKLTRSAVWTSSSLQHHDTVEPQDAFH